MSDSATIKAGRRSVEISHPGRELFPDAGCTKLDLARYYAGIARWMVPHLRDRPIHVRAYPQGIGSEGFVKKSVDAHYPDWLETATVAKRGGGEITQPVANGAASLAYLAGQNAVSLHGWLSRRDRPECPDQLIIDLDPTGQDFDEVRHASRLTREIFAELGLPAFLKTTGSRGLHVLAPLDRKSTFEPVRELARRIAATVAARDRESLTVETRKQKRRGRLFVDWLRNGYAQTAVVAYSVRARPGAPVAMPIDWNELEATGPRDYTIVNALERLERSGDPWRRLRSHAGGIRGPSRILERLARS